MYVSWALLFVFSYAVLGHDLEWESFKKTHGKYYRSANEENNRMKIFQANQQEIEEHNKLFRNGSATFFLKMNHFGDLTADEFKEKMNRLNYSKKLPGQKELYKAAFNGDIPATVDWRGKGAVTGVKNQGDCGACWAFSATGALEGQLYLTKGKLVPLSEQQLMDCSASYGNEGCKGGIMNQAFIYISSNGGIDTEDSYPYQGTVADCRFKAADVAATVTKVFNIQPYDEGALQTAVATVGPVSVSIDGSLKSFQFYGGGVYYDNQCNSTNPDHGALVVGYGTDDKGQEYWLVKNSWGPNWGEQGYARMARNKNNNCGIATSASYPKVG